MAHVKLFPRKSKLASFVIQLSSISLNRGLSDRTHLGNGPDKELFATLRETRLFISANSVGRVPVRLLCDRSICARLVASAISVGIEPLSCEGEFDRSSSERSPSYLLPHKTSVPRRPTSRLWAADQ